MPFEIKQLRYAVLAADTRSFARAAAIIGIKQATLSRRVANLELRIGVKLFERTTRGAMLTPAGAAFVDRARTILRDVDRLQTTARALGTGTAGELKIGFCAPLAASQLRSVVIEYLNRYPAVRVEGVEHCRCQLYHEVETGAVDIAVVTGWIPDDSLVRRPLWSERVLVALPEEHRLSGAERIYWTDLRDETIVLSEQDPGPDLAELVRAQLAEPGHVPEVSIASISRENVLTLVGAARFLTLVSEAALGVTHPQIVLRDVHNPHGPSRLDYAGYWRADNDSAPLKRFLALLSERYPG